MYFKIDNIGPYDVTNLQQCLGCNQQNNIIGTQVVQYWVYDITNNRVYRITLFIDNAYTSNPIVIERLI